MSPAIFSFLPLDLLDVILHYVRRADLTSICRTSKLFRVHALDALYSDMRLADNHSLQACFSILDDPQLAARVKRFAIYSNNTAGSFYGVIQDTLEVLPGLETLELSMGEGSSCQWLLPTNSCPFLLHTFLTDFPYTPEVQTFITSQPGIRNLTVPWASGVNYFGNLGFLGLRYLTTIFAPFSLVEALVPGRPIREVITFQDREDIHPDRISCLSKSTSISGIKRLQITAGFLRDIGPELLSKTLPSLSCLSVICRNFRPIEEELSNWIMKFLAGYPRLHCFDVRLDPSRSWEMVDYFPSAIAPSPEQELKYFAVPGRAMKLVNKQWTRCSTDETAWVLAHSTWTPN